MIYYATRQTLQRYKIKTLDEIFAGEVTPEEARFLAQVRQESGNRLYEWGCKLFYFDGRKSLQLMHFETRLVVFLIDMKQKELWEMRPPITCWTCMRQMRPWSVRWSVILHRLRSCGLID